jgi:hypothetical protein
MQNRLKNPDIRGGAPERPYSWRRESYSPEVNNLFERYTKGDKNVELVSMNDGKSVEINPDDEEKVIFTHGLGGCYATLVYTENENGTRNGVLTHYAPTQISRNMTRLRELISQHSNMKEAMVKQTVIIMGTGEWIQNPETKRWKFEPSSDGKQQTDAITIAIKAELGGNVEVKFEPYETIRLFGDQDYDILIAKIPPKDEGDAQFKTKYGFKKFGSEEK